VLPRRNGIRREARSLIKQPKSGCSSWLAGARGKRRILVAATFLGLARDSRAGDADARLRRIWNADSRLDLAASMTRHAARDNSRSYSKVLIMHVNASERSSSHAECDVSPLSARSSVSTFLFFFFLFSVFLIDDYVDIFPAFTLACYARGPFAYVHKRHGGSSPVPPPAHPLSLSLSHARRYRVAAALSLFYSTAADHFFFP